MKFSFIRIVFLGVFLFASRVVFAQDNVLRQKVTVIEDPQIVSLVQKHIYLNEKQKINGWRVQIFFESGNNSKSRAHTKKGLFMTLFPNTGVYLMFQSPYYKVRVGDFRSRMYAEGFKQKIIRDFPDSFVVKDEINFPEL